MKRRNSSVRIVVGFFFSPDPDQEDTGELFAQLLLMSYSHVK